MTDQKAAAPATALHDWFIQDVERPLEAVVGGHLRLRVVVLLAAVLGLNAADMATIGAVAAQLEDSLHIGNVEVGYLVTASTAVGALVTLPLGALADRVRRNRLLGMAITGWSLATLVGGMATSYAMLFSSRLVLGLVAAAASPLAASLIGDYFQPHERGRIYSYILAGELVGVAVGFLISGNLAALISWHGAFFVLGALGLVLAWIVWRKLPEPARGGSLAFDRRARAAGPHDAGDAGPKPRPDAPPGKDEVKQEVKARHIAAHGGQVLERDPTNWSLWRATRYVLSVRTYRLLVLASGLGYFYFAGLRTFAIVFMRGRFGLDQALASTLAVGLGLGAIVGVLLAGVLADRLIQHEHLTGRIIVAAAAFFMATAAFVPGLLLLAGVLLLRARCTYPRGVATAIASEEATRRVSGSAG